MPTDVLDPWLPTTCYAKTDQRVFAGCTSNLYEMLCPGYYLIVTAVRALLHTIASFRNFDISQNQSVDNRRNP